MFIVVVPEEVAAEYVDVFDGPEFAGECGAVLEGLEVRLRVRIVVGYVRPGVNDLNLMGRPEP